MNNALPADLRPPYVDDVLAFEAVLRLGSFERSAAELHVAARAVSKRVAAPQDLLGTPLMHDVVLPLASPRLLQAHAALKNPADLARLPLIRTPPEPRTPRFRAAVLDWIEPAHGAKLADLGMNLDAALCGQGVVLGRTSLAAR